MGYSGLAVYNHGKSSELPDSFVIHRKKIVAKHATAGRAASVAETYGEDTSGQIESLLIEKAAQAGVLDANERAYLLESAAK
jgi:hypothetical protein